MDAGREKGGRIARMEGELWRKGGLSPRAASEVMLQERPVLPILAAWPGNQPPLTHQNLSEGEQRHSEVTANGTGDLLDAC